MTRQARKSISKETIKEVFAYGNKCFYCGIRASGVDHIVPVSKGGTDEVDNLIPCCNDCNQRAKNHVFICLEDKKIFVLSRYITHQYQTSSGRISYIRRQIRKLAESYFSEGNIAAYAALYAILGVENRL